MIDLAFLGPYAAGLRIDGANLSHLDIDVGGTEENPPQREANVFRRQLCCSNLVEERLKLMVVMLVHQRNMYHRAPLRAAYAPPIRFAYAELLETAMSRSSWR